MKLPIELRSYLKYNMATHDAPSIGKALLWIRGTKEALAMVSEA
jgi:hypothetical protein